MLIYLFSFIPCPLDVAKSYTVYVQLIKLFNTIRVIEINAHFKFCCLIILSQYLESTVQYRIHSTVLR